MKKIITILFLFCFKSYATNFYFSASGNDAAAGTIGAPWQTLAKFNSVFASKAPGDQFLFNRGDVFTGSLTISRSGSAGLPITIGAPWQTISKFNSVFATKAPGDQFLFNRGDVFTGSLTISRSGSAGLPITIGAYGSGALPIINGFSLVSAWTNVGGNVWESTSAVSTLSTLNMVSVNGVNTAMGRYPNYPTYLRYQTRGNENLTTAFITASDLPSVPFNFAGTGAQIVLFTTSYTTARHPVTSQSGTTLVYNGSTAVDNLQNPSNYVPHYFFQNDVRTLDVAGEWFYNTSTKKIRVYSSGSPSGVRVATVDILATCSGRSYITFDNLAFTGSNGDAVGLGSSANHIVIQNSDFNFIGNNVVYNGGGNNTVNTCTINNCNNYGIDYNDNQFNTITNNSVKNIGLLIGMGALVTPPLIANGIKVTGDNNTISYNTVDSIAMVGIRYGGSNTICDHNFVNHATFGNGVSDGGGIYTYGGVNGDITTNMKCLYNIVLNSGNGGVGVYCDDHVNGLEVGYNSVANCYVGYQFHNNKNMNIHHNTSYNSVFECWLLWDELNWPNGSNTNNTNITMIQNIWFPRDNRINGDNWCMQNNTYQQPQMNTGFVSDSNYYCRPITPPATQPLNNLIAAFVLHPTQVFTSLSLPMWQSRNPGQDLHSKTAPVTVSNINQIDFEYNATNGVVVKSLNPGVWMDARSVTYSGTITLQPFTSAVLMNTGGVGNVNPTANAGADQVKTWPVNSATLSGSGNDPDGSIVAYNWTKISGPALFTITTPNASSTTVTGLDIGVYQFQLLVTDNSGGTGTDVMQVTVNKGAATINVSGTSKVYNGSPQGINVTTTPAGISTSTTYNGVVTQPTNAGSYATVTGITDPHWNFTPVNGTFTITKATATINAVSKTANFDGNPQTISSTTTPAGLTVLTTLYNGSAVAPSAIGVYSVAISLANANYQATTVNVTLTIQSNPAIIFISDTTKVYNGSAQSVTVTSAYSYTLTGSPQTNAGSYTVTATINDGIHTGSATATLTISKQPAVLSWTQPASMPYGSQVSALQLNATSNISGTFIYSQLIGDILPLGSRTMTALFVPTDSNNYSGGTVTVTINVFSVSPFGQNWFISPNGQFFFIEQ